MKIPLTGQANLGNRSDASVAVALSILKARGVKAIGLQEAGDRRAVITAWCRKNGWVAWFGDGSPGAASTPIIYERGVGSNPGTRKATDATDAGPLGAGPDVVKAKVWNRVRIDVDGEPPFVFINGHLPASLYLPRRRKIAKKMIAVLVDMVEKREDKIGVVVVGDFNADFRSLILRPLRRLGMKQWNRRPTHGRRCIDHVWTLGISQGAARTLVIPSDHRAVIFTKETR